MTGPGVTVLHDARLWDGLSDHAEGGATVVIEGKTIREAGPRAGFRGDARRIDCGGHVLKPGLFDAHCHANAPSYDFHGSWACALGVPGAHRAFVLTNETGFGRTVTAMSRPGAG